MPADDAEPMTTTELQDTLATIFESLADAREENDGDDDDATLADMARDMVADLGNLGRVATFENCGLLTSNDGLVLTFENGSEFQITIVQSR